MDFYAYLILISYNKLSVFGSILTNRLNNNLVVDFNMGRS